MRGAALFPEKLFWSFSPGSRGEHLTPFVSLRGGTVHVSQTLGPFLSPAGDAETLSLSQHITQGRYGIWANHHTGSTVKKQREDQRWDQAIKPEGLPLVINCGAPDTERGGKDLLLTPSKGAQPCDK